MKKVGIIYLGTGPYISFWKNFYDTFEAHFLQEFEKNYYVFTDAPNVYMQENNPHIFVHKLESKPWPLVTLLRFHTFLSIEEELKKNDYVLFSNANIVCERDIQENEIIPTGEQTLFFTQHPAFVHKNRLDYPYERRRNSTAFVPYKKGRKYVIGAFFGGETESFLSMSKVLKQNIDEDLKHNRIAIWHDESHLNCFYMLHAEKVKLLSPSYCYPFGTEPEYEKIIAAVGKAEVFDVAKFKGQNEVKHLSFGAKVINAIGKRLAMVEKWCLRRIMFLVSIVID